MTLVLIASQPNGTRQDTHGEAKSDQVEFRQANGTAPDHFDGTLVATYTDSAGTGSSTAAFSADSRGRWMRYIASGFYKQIVNPSELSRRESLDFHALPGSVESNINAGATIYRASGGDDLAAILALFAAGKSVYAPDPLYLISGDLLVPNTLDFNCAGLEKTVIRATAAGARVRWTARGGKSGNFYFDGNNTATNGLQDESTERLLENIRVVNTVGDGIQVGTLNGSAQNTDYVNVKAHNCGGSPWVFDGGCGNIDLYGCYGEHAGRYVIESKRSGASPSGGGTQPFNIRFHGGIFERPQTVAPLSVADGLGVVGVTAGADVIFKGTNLSISGVTTADLPIIYANLSDAGANTARVIVETGELDGNAGTATGLKAANGGQIIVDGRPLLRNCLYAYDFDDSSTIYPDRTALSSVTNTHRARGSKSGDSQVRDIAFGPREVRRASSSDTVLAWRLEADSGWRGLIKADGNRRKGTGSTFTETSLVGDLFGAGTPESSVTAPPGSTYQDTTSGILYVKKTGTGNTGWKALPLTADFGHPEGFFALTAPSWFGNTLVLGSGTWYGLRFCPSISFTSSAIGFRVTAFSATDDPAEVTVHDSSGTRLATSGSTTGKLNATNNLKSITLAQAFEAGTQYYVGFVATSTATLAAFALNNSLAGRFFGDSLGQVDAISIAGWGVGNAAALTGQAAAGTVPGLTVLR